MLIRLHINWSESTFGGPFRRCGDRCVRHYQRPVRGGCVCRLRWVCKFEALFCKAFDNRDAHDMACLEHLLNVIAVDIKYQLKIQRAQAECGEASPNELGAIGLDYLAQDVGHPGREHRWRLANQRQWKVYPAVNGECVVGDFLVEQFAVADDFFLAG